jgi:hypothetical protein
MAGSLRHVARWCVVENRWWVEDCSSRFLDLSDEDGNGSRGGMVGVGLVGGGSVRLDAGCAG